MKLQKTFMCIALLLLSMSCSLDLPENTKSLKTCTKATGITVTPQSSTSPILNLSLTGTLSDIAKVVWVVSQNSTEYYRSSTITSSPFSVTTPTLTVDGTLTITAQIVDKCGMSYNLTSTYVNKTCSKATGITVTPVQNPFGLLFDLSLTGTTSDIANVVWVVSQNSTEYYRGGLTTTSPFNGVFSFSLKAPPTPAVNGALTITAQIVDKCGMSYSLTSSFVACVKATGITATAVQSLTSLNFNLSLIGTTSEIASVVWIFSQNSTEFFRSGSSPIIFSPFLITRPTLTTNGAITITAQIVDKCGLSYNLTSNINIFYLPIEMLPVEGGTFQMGSIVGGYLDQMPVHPVTLSSFNISKYEITQAQWKAVMGVNPSYFSNCDNCPIENVYWEDIQLFLTKLKTLTGKTYRLPTEAEWEYAARGGKLSKGYAYSGSNNLGDVAWYYDNSDNKTHPVGQKAANELGVYDMTGNVQEWCSDWAGDYTANSQLNPTGPSTGVLRVVRSSSYLTDSSFCRVAFRFNLNPIFRSYIIGFRVVSSQ